MDARLVALAGHAPLAVLRAADLAIKNGAHVREAYFEPGGHWALLLTHLRNDSLRMLYRAGFFLGHDLVYVPPRARRMVQYWDQYVASANADLMRCPAAQEC